MLNFVDYRLKFCKGLSIVKAYKMYNLYISGEVEVLTEGKITMKDVMKAKQALVAADIPASHFVPCTGVMANMFAMDIAACCNTQPCQKEENPMTCDTNTERAYLKRQLEQATYAKRNDLLKMFHVHDTISPRTYAELIDWVKTGKYTLNTKETAKVDAAVAADGWYGSFVDGILWNGRGFTNDWAGYHAAEEVRVQQQTIAERIIMTGTAAEGLAALQAFEAWLPTPATPAN